MSGLTYQFCKCNNCEEVFVDINPNDQPYFEMPKDGVYIHTCLIEDEDGMSYGCPTCKTDKYLVDVHDENDLCNFSESSCYTSKKAKRE